MRRWTTRWLLRGGMVCALLHCASADAAITDLIDRLRGMPGMPAAPNSLGREPRRKILLNGFPLHLVTGQTADSVESVLTFYASQLVSTEARERKETPPVLVRKQTALGGYLFSTQRPDIAMLGRVKQGQAPLASTGPLRMVHAQRVGSVTQYLAAWSDAAIPPAVIEPASEGDAPGRDLPDVPRPLGVRVFSFEEPATGYALVSYRVAAPARQALQTTLDRLLQAGFRADEGLPDLTRSAEGVPTDRGLAHVSRAGRGVLVSVRPASDPQSSVITYVSRAF